MVDTKRRAAVFGLGVAGLILVWTLLYQAGMRLFEGESVGFVHSLYIVAEAFSTAGFGLDTGRWDSQGILLLMVVMQFTGVGVIFLTLPTLIVPLLEGALSPDPPTTTEASGHVILCTLSSRGETLLRELQARDQSYTIVTDDRERALELADDHDVVTGDPAERDVLRAANVEQARALVADADDETNAGVILAARSLDSDLRIVSVAETERVADYHRYAGADRVVSPRRLVGRTLGAKATTIVSDEFTSLVDAVEGSTPTTVGEATGDDGAPDANGGFSLAELLVHRESPLTGTTIGEAVVTDQTGVNILGVWDHEQFDPAPGPDYVIDAETVLLVAGSGSQLEAIKDLTLSENDRLRRGPVIVAGYGRAGRAVTEELAKGDEDTTVIDRESFPGVDVVGDVTEPATLEAAGVHEAKSVVLALDSDTTTIFAALAIRQLAPEVEVIARANDESSMPKLYRAGVGYALSLATVSGRILASSLLDEEVVRPETQVELIRTAAPALVGQSLAEADVRARTKATVVAIERNGRLLTEVGPNTVVQADDELVVAGSDEAVATFSDLAT